MNTYGNNHSIAEINLAFFLEVKNVMVSAGWIYASAKFSDLRVEFAETIASKTDEELERWASALPPLISLEMQKAA